MHLSRQRRIYFRSLGFRVSFTGRLRVVLGLGGRETVGD